MAGSDLSLADLHAAPIFGYFVKATEAAALLSPHPGQVKAELNSDGTDPVDPVSGQKLSDRIHDMLFADSVEEQGAPAHV